ncbi:MULTISPECIES: hypothetical protein [unclassified Leeuwenhoekiella]|uniref:hypothetical protein n=1 Tax=unclassified Leeuwenhoekiella TaxID=2615029 RepID=UPI000C589CE2|nr:MULTISPECIES: hypothetical protein [unclassified Leeuwenhoekiella]MAW96027.1 hypothetical protein [Leeuwenhoekiella sp.]MBA80021.1 hypothetical protein [Leeuwenhoekiella sp.]|tara:strand:+ start:23571 stop:23951 length:381 start_codon:yes stop_codon:yes gene_type:complete
MLQILYLLFFGAVNFLIYYLFVRDVLILRSILIGLILFSGLFILIQNYYLYEYGMPNDLFFTNLKNPLIFLLFFSIAGKIIEEQLPKKKAESGRNNILVQSIKFFRTGVIFVATMIWQMVIVLSPY